MKTYLVGGAVRDKLLGLKVKEKDWLVVGATPEQMLDKGFTPVGKDFPVFLHPETKEEYALARTERKSGTGYKGFTVYAAPTVSVEEDLFRRDLTINAIAKGANDNIIDPYNGQQDLDNRILRHVSPAFIEDPLRVLRLARFAAQFKHLGFTVAEETVDLVKEIARSGELDTLVPERIWQELKKALDSKHPDVFIEVLRQGEALAVIFPEIDALFGVEQRADYHPEIDTGTHLLMCLQQAEKLGANTRTRYAVLGHDLGKANTPKDILPRHIGHEARSKRLVDKLSKRLRAPKDFSRLASLVAEHHLLCHTAMELKASTVLKLFKNLSALKEPTHLEEFLCACEADARGRLGFEDRDYPQKQYLISLLDAARSVNNDQIDSSQFKGAAFGVELDRLRTQAIQSAKNQRKEKHYE